MTKEQAIKFLSNTKVYVKDKSEEIQEKLFEIGFAWDDAEPNQKVQYIDRPFIFIYDNKQLTHSTDVKWFYDNQKREITPEDILNITIDEPTYRPFKEILKQEHLYRPFNDAKECWQEMLKHQPFGWIKHKEKIYWAAIASLDNTIEYKLAFEKYTFADGTPFGIKED